MRFILVSPYKQHSFILLILNKLNGITCNYEIASNKKANTTPVSTENLEDFINYKMPYQAELEIRKSIGLG